MKWYGQESNGLIFLPKNPMDLFNSIWANYNNSPLLTIIIHRFTIDSMGYLPTLSLVKKASHPHQDQVTAQWQRPQTGVSPVSGHYVLKVHPGSTRASEMLGVSWCLQ